MTREEREYFYRKLQNMFAEWAASHETTPDIGNAFIKTFADRYMGSVTGQQPLPQELFRIFLSELRLPSVGQSTDDVLISALKGDVNTLKTDVETLKSDVGDGQAWNNINNYDTVFDALDKIDERLTKIIQTIKVDNLNELFDLGLSKGVYIVRWSQMLPARFEYLILTVAEIGPSYSYTLYGRGGTIYRSTKIDDVLQFTKHDIIANIEDLLNKIGSMNFGSSLEDQETISEAIGKLGDTVGDMDNGDMDADFMGNHSILSYLKFMDTVLDVRELEHIIMGTEDTIASILYNNLMKVKSLDKLVGMGNWGNNFIDGDDLSVCVGELSRYLGYADDWTTQSQYTTVYNAIDSITNSISSLSSRIDNLENDCGANDGELKGLTTGQAFDYLITKINGLH